MVDQEKGTWKADTTTFEYSTEPRAPLGEPATAIEIARRRLEKKTYSFGGGWESIGLIPHGFPSGGIRRTKQETTYRMECWTKAVSSSW